jgi:peptide/nickel transport system permease protein
MRIARFVARRVGTGLLSLLLFLFILFVLIEVLIPGDVASLLRLGLTNDEFQDVRDGLGLTRPLPVRFLIWLGNFLSGDYATTSFGRRASRHIFDALPPTVIVFVIGLAIAYVLGGYLGRFTSWRPGRLSQGITMGAVLAYTAFPAFLAYLLNFFFLDLFHTRRLNWVGNHGLLWAHADVTESVVMLRMTLTFLAVVGFVGLGAVHVRKRHRLRPSRLLGALAVAALSVGVWWAMGIGRFAADILFRAAVPILGMALLSMGEFVLITQTAMAGTTGEDYVLTAHAKGVKPRLVRDDHAGRNAVLVVLSRLAVSLPYLLTGLVVIETAMSWPGLGSFMFDAVQTQDLPVVMSSLAIIGIMTLAVRIALDIAHMILDPRIEVMVEEPML